MEIWQYQFSKVVAEQVMRIVERFLAYLVKPKELQQLTSI
jgi:hypothetical protein